VTEPMVRIEHCVGTDGKRYCVPGMRAFAARHGLDFRAFLRGGVPAAELERTGDAMALRAAQRARKEHEHGQQ